MSAEENGPFKGGKPSEPPRGGSPGEPGHLGPGITPPKSSEPSDPSGPGGGKTFCSNCGKEWPANTKFCTACGTWMKDDPEKEQKSYKEHIDKQIEKREEMHMPSFVKEGPPTKVKKGRSPILSVIIIILCGFLIDG